MKYGLKRAVTTLLTAAVTLALLVAGSYAWSRFSVENPLDLTLRAHPAVTSLEMGQRDGVNVVTVTLGDVEDIYVAHKEIDEIVMSRMAPDSYRIETLDTRTAHLSDIYHKLHFDVAEAMATGSFTQMSQRIDENLGPSGLDRWKVWVSSTHIYIQLHQGDSYLYEIMERPVTTTP